MLVETSLDDARAARAWVLAGLLAAGAAGMLLPAGVAAGADLPDPRCGKVVEERIILDRDLRCPGPALIARNPRTLIQLNGHSIVSGRPCADAPDVAGIVIESGAERVQILGPGAIRGFATGIAAGGAQGEIHDLRIADSCSYGLAVRDADGVRARNLTIHRNGGGPGAGGGVRVERAEGFSLEASAIFQNVSGATGAAVELRGCSQCRIAGNRILANEGPGLRLDVESHSNQIERNTILGHRPIDVVEEGSDNALVLNLFERSEGTPVPELAPFLGASDASLPAVAGCGNLHATVAARTTVTLTCPQDPGLRGLRNSVVAYRLLNPFDTRMVFPATCSPAEVKPATSGGGGALSCTNADATWTWVLEITCCLN